MMFVRDEGEGEAVLLLHGLGASGRVFDPLFARRRADRRLIAVDLPRTARSKRWAASDPQAVARALLRWLDERKIERFHVFGHSFGGLVGLVLGSQVPQRVRSLTVASAPALGMPEQLKLMLHNPLADASMAWLGRLPAFRPMLRSYLRFIWGEPRTLAEHHLGIYEEALRAEGFGQGLLEGLRSIAGFQLDAPGLLAASFPKHVLWGEKDPLVHVSQGERLANAIGADFTVLRDTGHCVPEERPEAVDDALHR